MTKVHKPTFLIVVLFVASLFLSGCQTMSPNQRTVLGTTLGGVAGALAGSQVGGGSGQVVAIALGAALGGFVGNQFANHLNNREQESLARTTQLALSADDEKSGTINWQSQERNDVVGQVQVTRTVTAEDSQASGILGMGRGEALSNEERMMLGRLEKGTPCRATRTALSVEDRNVADGSIWCRTAEGDYKPLQEMAA